MPNVDDIRALIGRHVEHHGSRILAEGTHLDVFFQSGRAQKVTVEASDRHLLFESVAVRKIAQRIAAEKLAELILRNNHATEAVGLRRKQAALTAFIKLYQLTLNRDEAIHAILAVAREADRMQELITGADEG